jgi:hypothetical protein
MNDQAETRIHQLLRFKSQAPPKHATSLAVQLANYYSKSSHSRNSWKSQPTIICEWELVDKDPKGDGSITSTRHFSKPFSAEQIRKHLITFRAFDHSTFNLPSPSSDWLDSSISITPGFHSCDSNGQVVKFEINTQLGDRFPLKPRLDREGTAYTSFQIVLIRRLLELRESIVSESHRPSDIHWFQNLRTLMSEAVSLVENTLHQLFYKAQYDPLPGWIFDPKRLDKRPNKRLSDKLAWVHSITGKALDERDAVAALMRVKSIRNHLQHFDPPVFAFSMEECAVWLNDVAEVGYLAWCIRRNTGALPSTDLIRLILAPDVVFNPKDPSRRRAPPAPGTGYASTSEHALAHPIKWPADGSTVALSYCRKERPV